MDGASPGISDQLCFGADVWDAIVDVFSVSEESRGTISNDSDKGSSCAPALVGSHWESAAALEAPASILAAAGVTFPSSTDILEVPLISSAVVGSSSSVRPALATVGSESSVAEGA
jgi:hypothetical protein